MSGLLDALSTSFAAALKAPEGIAPPVAVVWTDADGQWRELAQRLRSVLPQVYQLGDYNAASRVGPAIWLKCIVDRSVDGAPPAGTTPILYLPGVSRQTLRAGGDCPPELQPLIELQFRGRVWHQANGRDWSVEAFLTSSEGLGLDVASDARTREAMLRALPLLADADLEALRGRRLDDADFNKLAVSDPVRDLLRWVADPDGFRTGLDAGRWESFRQVCRAEFGLDPDDTTPAEAARRLATGGGSWDHAWRRFRESPRLYRGVARQLREPAAAPDYLLVDPSRQPRRNDEDEARLRRELAAAAKLPHHEACARVLALEAEHGTRRGWVWAELGESPLVIALEPLARLAEHVRSPLAGPTLEVLVKTYADGGWRADRAALETLAAAARWKNQDRDMIARVVRAIYLPWLDASARRFQACVGERVDGLRDLVSDTPAEPETCVVFADGLRLDIGALVQSKLEVLAYRVRLAHRIAPLPTVTATAKPAASPVADALAGKGTPESFAPVLADTGQESTAQRLRDAMAARGVEVVEKGESRIPAGLPGGGWTEMGELDTLGHKLGAGLAAQVDDEAERIANRVAELLDAGWSRVRVVTDHGWLLLPGGLPKVELPPYLVATRWARCAMVRGASTPDVPTHPWHWNQEARIASPPGVAAFSSGCEYAHGGVSPQECVVPELIVERTALKLAARIAGVEWRGMRCRVTVEHGEPSVRVDLRRNRRQPETSLVAQVKALGSATEVSFPVPDDHEGAAATVVLLDSAGNVLDHKVTTVGES